MSSIDQPGDKAENFFSDTGFLKHLIPDLEVVRRKRGGWNDYGEMVGNQLERDGWSRSKREGTLWERAKRVVHLAMTGDAAKDAAIRARVQSPKITSAIMLADLSLWLAGEMGVSISVTKRLVAAMLLGVVESKGNWDALGE